MRVLATKREDPPLGRRRAPSQQVVGFTLLEVMLVLTLMVVMATLANVNLRGGFRHQRLLKAADQVRTAWANAQIDAIKTGRVQVFQHSADSNRFYWSPQASLDDPQVDEQDAAIAFGRQDDSSNAIMGLSKPDTLPRGVRFIGADVRLDQQSSLLMSESPDPNSLVTFTDDEDPLENQDIQWGMPIFFFPDGTCSNAEMILQNDGEQFVRVYLRGMTGIAHVGRVTSSLQPNEPVGVAR